MVNTRKWTNRKKKYRGYESDVFALVNENPLKQITGDCVLRAITTASGNDYITVSKDLFELQLETGIMMDDPKCYELYLGRLGFIKQKQPRKANNTKYRGQEFCEWLKENNVKGDILCHIGGHHIVAIKDYKIHDTWYSLGGSIGNWWVRR